MAKISKITPLGSSTTYDIAAWSLKQQGRLTDANITHETDGSMVHFKSSSSMTANKPMGDGNILHFHWDGNASNSWDAQLYIPDSHTNALQWRGHTNATTWGTGWHTVLDDQNYSTTCDTRYVKKAGDTMTGTLTVPKINLSRNTGTSYGRLQWYNNTYKTWTDYMSNAASGTCPSGGTPSTLGNVTTWAIRSYIESSSGYGWLWESAAESNTGTPTARMALSAYDGTLQVAGLIKSTLNSNTVTIGSQNTGFCHFTNSANIPYYFDHEVQANGGFWVYNGNGSLGRVGKGVSWYLGRSNALVRVTTSPTSNGWNPITSCKTTSGDWSTGILGETYYFVYTTDTNFNAGTNTTSNGVRITNTSQLYGAVWNDYAEYRKDNPNETQKPGRCVRELGDGTLSLTTKRLERGCEIVSDTFGFAVGQDEENGYNTPIASNGRVLAYPYESIEEFTNHIGWPVCSGPDGTVSIMTEEEEEKYPSRIIGMISEIPTYEEWGTGKVKVDGRVWIRIR